MLRFRRSLRHRALREARSGNKSSNNTTENETTGENIPNKQNPTTNRIYFFKKIKSMNLVCLTPATNPMLRRGGEEGFH